MLCRDFLISTAAGSAALTAPAVRAAGLAAALRYVAQTDLAMLDPGFTSVPVSPVLAMLLEITSTRLAQKEAGRAPIEFALPDALIDSKVGAVACQSARSEPRP
jgi:hypothetical protein